MKYFTAVAAIVSLVPGIASMTINTPTSVVQCQPQLLSWADGVAPYYLTIIPGGQASAAPLKSFDKQSGNSITWMVDIPGGTSVTFALKDSTGATAYTDMVTIQKGSDTSCTGGSSQPQPAAGNTGAGPSSPQAADATSSSASVGAPGSGGSGGASTGGTTSRPVIAASSAVTRSVSTPTPVSATAQRTTTAVAGPAGTPSPAGSITSGAKGKADVARLAVIGVLGLLGVLVL